MFLIAWTTFIGSSVEWTIAQTLIEMILAEGLIQSPFDTIPFALKYHVANCPHMTEGPSFKQVLVVRLDLDMGRGKAAVQCAHAAVSAAEEARNHEHSWWRSWMDDGQLKVAVKVPDLETILELERKGRSKGIPVHLVRDKGLTQVPPGTITCLGIGPAPADIVDSLTGNLALF